MLSSVKQLDPLKYLSSAKFLVCSNFLSASNLFIINFKISKNKRLSIVKQYIVPHRIWKRGITKKILMPELWTLRMTLPLITVFPYMKFEMNSKLGWKDIARTNYCGRNYRRTDGRTELRTDGRTNGEKDGVQTYSPPTGGLWGTNNFKSGENVATVSNCLNP